MQPRRPGASASDPSLRGPLRCHQHVLLLTLSSCRKTPESPRPRMQKARSSVGPGGPTGRLALGLSLRPVGERSHSRLLRCLPPRVTPSAPHLSPRWGDLTLQWRGRRPSEELPLGLGRSPAHPLKGEGSGIPAERQAGAQPSGSFGVARRKALQGQPGGVGRPM